ncbi:MULTISPECIES: flagellar biosynthesis protein FliQ [Moritella]|uniref:Flagellar biosynthetic protein FliQ n=1 Tax=Moritella viscosa TaxID=80854 RepID=A0A1L0AXD5_9GAMM|nr:MULTISPECIES: flagellar biosynthesis protein FliQ [Moritella]QUM79754.1 flagellar biosynthesis protein FliQ [Moritella sp. 5]QUM83977.1 flagellar biosynthesis protein FliQ [Moritella sp. 28]QUM88284.1 flagellar biosynthesis protein FliQ [Moritella sp. 36]SGY88121.1 Flagellar biosynthesis protein [Moritella viscosa]SGY91385.1 Flagellar biosynthesis protein [Moritella viscosa]
MAPEVFVDIFRQALWTVLLLVCAVVVPGLLVGLVVSVFQAATSINEQTLSFLPRLIATLLALIYGAHWGFARLMEFFTNMMLQVPQVVG